MGIIMIIIGCIAAITLIVTVLGMTLRDIQAIHLDKQYRRHPHARRWRHRPLVSIIIDGDPSEACLASIRRSNYRKVEIVSTGQAINGELILSLPPNIVLERTAISQAIKQFNNDPSQSQIELTPVLQSPQTLRQFFRVYYQIASAPFIESRAGLGIFHVTSHWPVITRMNIPHSKSTLVYQSLSWLMQTVNLATLLYVSYIAVQLHQPEFLLAYLGAFGLWMIMAISSYRYLSFSQKIAYLLLSPASLIYFAFLCLIAPFHLRHHLAFIFARRQSAIIEA